MMALCVNRLILRKVRKQDRKTPEFQKKDIWATAREKKMPEGEAKVLLHRLHNFTKTLAPSKALPQS